MFHFWYKKEEPVTKFTIILAAAVIIFSLTGAAFLAQPAVKAAAKIIKDYRDRYHLIVIKPQNCKDCFDIYQVSDFIKGVKGIKIGKAKEYADGSQNAELLIKTYKIKNLPTFVLRGDIETLALKDVFDEASIGFMDDNVFVYNNEFPPFYNLDEKKIRGEFDVTYLTDNSCVKCYDVYLHDKALDNLVMKPVASSTVDISSVEGKKILNDYKIKSVPTMIIKGDMDAYQNFKKLWETVGTIEKDGAYIFREDGLKLMGVYKNLINGALMNVVK